MSKRVLVIILALVIATLAGTLAGCGGDLPKGAVAKVGDRSISQDDLDQLTSEIASKYGITEDNAEYYAMVKSDALDQLITIAAISLKADELGITVTDDDVQTQWDNVLNSYYGGDEAQLEEALASYNMTEDQAKEELRLSLLSQKVYEEVTKDTPEPTDAEISAYYDENQSSFYSKESRTVRHILIMPTPLTSSDTSGTDDAGTTTTSEATDADWAAALAKANEVRAKLVAGGDWATLAAEYSDDPNTKDSGGELGSFKQGETVTEFDDAMFSLQLNEISQPIKTIYGYHIIQVTAITAAYQQTLDEVRDTISATLLSQAKDDFWVTWLDNAKTELGVTYREDLAPTTTLPATPIETDTTDGSEGQTITTTAPATTTTVAP